LEKATLKMEAEKSSKMCSNKLPVINQPHDLVVRVSDYRSWGHGFDSWFYHGDFSLKGKIPMVTMVWVVY
jgi:hypothetical protein